LQQLLFFCQIEVHFELLRRAQTDIKRIS
jgi:hypothetical protein